MDLGFGKRPAKRKKPVPLQPLVFAQMCEAKGLPRPQYQARIHPWRDYIYDFAWGKQNPQARS